MQGALKTKEEQRTVNRKTKVGNLLEEAKLKERSHPEEALVMAREALKIAEMNFYKQEKAEALTRIGRCLWITGKLNEAIEALNLSLETSKLLPKGGIEAEALNALGNVYLYMKTYDHAMDYYGKALEMSRSEELPELEAGILNNLGGLHKELHDLDTALGYYRDSLEKYEINRDNYGQAIPLFNSAEVYMEQKNWRESKENIDKVLEICKEKEAKVMYSYSLHLLGKMYKNQGSPEAALKEFYKSLNLAQETKDYHHQVVVYKDLYEIMLEKNNLKEAIGHVNNALEIAKSIDGEALISDLYASMAQVYEQMGEEFLAYKYYKAFYETTTKSEARRREEKLRSVSFQLQLEKSQKETKTYRHLVKELEKMTQELRYTYKQMEVVGKIGQNITATLDLEQIFDLLYENLNQLMEAMVLGIGLLDNNNQKIRYELFIEKGEKQPTFEVPVDSKNSWAVWCLENKRDVLINDVDLEYSNYLEGTSHTVGEPMQSVLFCPLMVEDQAIGVVTVQSLKKNVYSKHQLETLKTLSSYLAIAINNSQKSKALKKEIKTRKKAEEELKIVNSKLQKLSELDGLTNIPNRRCFDKNFEYVWNNAHRGGEKVSLLLLDVDFFKEYNDHYGHLDGDKVLQRIAKTIEGNLKRSTDLVARYGGDEFVVLLPNTDQEGALMVAKILQQRIRELKLSHGYSQVSPYITLSIGAATLQPIKGIQGKQLIDRADKALYESKEKGRNEISLYSREQ